MSAPHVAGGASTLSKYPHLFPEAAPPALAYARGSRVWTEDRSRAYIDWISGLLAVTLGYDHPEVTNAVVAHLGRGGPTWSLPHALEEDVAATIARLCGHPDWQVRFFKTGSEACSAAVRIARAVTGMAGVLSIGYHGWHDSLLTTPPAWGVPLDAVPHVVAAPFNQIDAVVHHKEWGDGIGPTIITEPETTEAPVPGYLQSLRDLCAARDSLLIYDECITGSRYPEFTAGRHYGVEPDLYVFSKGLANGYPLACVVGAREIMRCFDVDWRPGWAAADGPCGPVYCSGTWSGETVGLAAAKATLAVWERDGVAAQVLHRGGMLQHGLRAAVQEAGLTERVRIKGHPYRIVLDCPALADKTAIMARLLAHGHLIGAGWNVTAAHTERASGAVRLAFDDALARLDEPAGRPVVAPYRQQ